MTVVLALLGASLAYAAGPCAPPDAFENLRSSLPGDPNLRAEALEKYLADHPLDIWAHRLYLDGAPYHRLPVRRRYESLAAEHPDSLDFAYLRARSLVGSNTAEALRLFEEIEARDNGYPWIYRARMAVYRSTLKRDPAKLEAAAARFAALCPDWREPGVRHPGAAEAFQDWTASHPNAAPQEMIEQAGRWKRQFPGSLLGYITQLEALARIETTTPEQLDGAASEVLAFDTRFPYEDPEDPAPHQVARVFLRRGVFLGRIPTLIGQTIERLRDPERLVEIDINPMPYRASRLFRVRVNSAIEAWQTAARAHLKLGDPEAARAVVRQMQDHLAAHAPPADEVEPNVRRYFGEAEGRLFATRAELALAEGNKADALLYFRQAQAAAGFPGEYVAPQARLWRELGGSAEGWYTWQDSIPPRPWSEPPLRRPKWTAAARTLPPFTLRDQSGNTWTLDRLKGKTTLVSVWASWCGPCREELPYVQQLADRIQDRTTAQVVTLNIDDDPRLAERFRQSIGLTVPALLAKEYVDSVDASFTLPWNWIVSPEGIVIREQTGFYREGWIDEALRHLP